MTKILDLYKRLPDVFDSSAIAKEIADVDARTINRHIGRYVDRKMVIRIGKGFYAKTSANKFGVAVRFYGGYIGFSSALYLHGLKNELEDTIYVCTEHMKSARGFGGSVMNPVYLGKMCFGTTFVNDILVSTYPKTIFDMFYRPKYANFFDLYRALKQRRLGSVELDELMHYIKMSNLSTIRRAGYVLEGIAPKAFTDRLQRLNESRGKSFFLHKTTLNFSKKWRIYDDINVKRWADARI